MEGGENLNSRRIIIVIFALIIASMVLSTSNAAISDALLNTLDYTYYHGYTTSWDRGSATHNGNPGTSDAYYSTSTGQLTTWAGPGIASAWAYMNSGPVYAVAGVSSITVTIWYTSYTSGAFLAARDMTVKLYVNGIYQSEQTISRDLSSSGSEQFTFTGLNVQTGNDIDVDVIFSSRCFSDLGRAENTADFSYVAFTT